MDKLDTFEVFRENVRITLAGIEDRIARLENKVFCGGDPTLAISPPEPSNPDYCGCGEIKIDGKCPEIEPEEAECVHEWNSLVKTTCKICNYSITSDFSKSVELDEDTILISRKEYEELKEKAWKYDDLSK